MRQRNTFIAAALLSLSMILTSEWIYTSNHRKRHVTIDMTEKPSPFLRRSVTLNDGEYDYPLNLTSFELEFPHLQSYRCSLIHSPREEPEDDTTQPLVVLAIKSHPGSGHRRSVLRKTWAREWEIHGYRVRPIFLMGRTLSPGEMEIVKYESLMYEDTIQWDFTEGHHNLSLKERCFLEWLHHRIPHVAFVFKGDDDEFVNPEAVVQYVTEHGSPNTVHGRYQHRPLVMRKTKYNITHTLFPLKRYPGFVSGGGFIFPGVAVRRLCEASRLLPVFPLDDVYFGFLALAVNMTFRHDTRFYMFGLKFDVCKYKEALVVHGIDSRTIVQMWEDVQKSKC